MNFCKIITDFNIKDFDILKENYELKKVTFFVDDKTIKTQIDDWGYDVEDFTQYFGTSSPTLYNIMKDGINITNKILDDLSDIKYNNIKIITGLKMVIVNQIITLKKIELILNEKKNIIFLFTNSSHHYFGIPSIAKELGFESSGVKNIINSKLELVNFSEKFQNRYLELYKKSGNKENKIDIKELEEEISQILVNFETKLDYNNSKCGFFLITNPADFYLKPVWPILRLFNETKSEYSLFTFEKRTSNHVIERGFTPNDLNDYVNKITAIINHKIHVLAPFFDNLQQKSDTFFDVLKKEKKRKNSDIILTHYFTHFKNNITIRNVSRILATILVVETIFKKLKFKTIMIAADGSPNNDLVCEIAKKYKIPTFFTIPANTEDNPLCGFMYNASKLLLSGNNMKDELLRLKVKDERLIITGNPKFDYIKKIEKKKEKSKKLIVVAMSRMHENDEEWMSSLIHFCNKKNLDILIKIHPGYKFVSDTKKIIEKKISEINDNCKNLDYKIMFEGDVQEILINTDVLITEYSNIGIEAALNDIPIIVANMNSEQFFDHSYQYNKENVALYCTNIDELCNSIEKILNDVDTIQHLRKGRKDFNYKYNFLNDGNASKRTFEILSY